MGIDIRLENRRGECLRELQDPRGYVVWILNIAGPTSATCLGFIDPYGFTVFNQLQIAKLREELEAIRPLITTERFQAEKEAYIASKANRSRSIRDEASRLVNTISVDNLREHLDNIIDLVAEGMRRGPHHYCRFNGD